MLQWSAWHPLSGIGRNRAVTSAPGLYRIRRIGSSGMDYIGQTGNSLHARLGMLGGVYDVDMS